MSNFIARLEQAAIALVGPTSAADRVFIMESDGISQCFPYARPLNLKVNDQARMPQHTLEDGSTITDHLVIDPISIEIQMIFIKDFRDTHAEMRAAYEEGRLLTIQTKTHTYPNMVITALPHAIQPNLVGVRTIRPTAAACRCKTQNSYQSNG